MIALLKNLIQNMTMIQVANGTMVDYVMDELFTLYAVSI